MTRLTKSELQSILEQADVPNGGPLWPRVSPDVDWQVMGSGPGTGQYHDLKELRAKTLERLLKHVDGELSLKVVNVIVGDNPEWTTLELEAKGTLKKGELGLSSGDILLCYLVLCHSHRANIFFSQVETTTTDMP